MILVHLSNLEMPTDQGEINYLNWSPFEEETGYFAPSEKEFMINYRVQNIEGNKIELWEPVDSIFTEMGGPTTK